MLLMTSTLWKRVTLATLNVRDHLCKGKVGSLRMELNRAQFLLNSCKTRHMFMFKMNIKVRIGKC